MSATTLRIVDCPETGRSVRWCCELRPPPSCDNQPPFSKLPAGTVRPLDHAINVAAHAGDGPRRILRLASQHHVITRHLALCVVQFDNGVGTQMLCAPLRPLREESVHKRPGFRWTAVTVSAELPGTVGGE